MSRPQTTMVQMAYRNPGASLDLIIPVLVVSNTSNEQLEHNITVNSQRDVPWLYTHHAHAGTAIMCGGGPSLIDHLDDIRRLQAEGGKIFAMNAASRFLRSHGIAVDAQVIADAKLETTTLYDSGAAVHFLASQVHPDVFDKGGNIVLWHLAIDEQMDRLFPEQRRKQGGYSLVGGGASVGNSALCMAYVLGYREFELFGYDSSHRDGESHAYNQEMNRFIPTVDVIWGGKRYQSSVAMKAQAEKFQFTAQSLKREGCVIRVHGDGLLPAMWNTDPKHLTEQDKYRLLWSTDTYREVSPAEQFVPLILEVLQPKGLILDFGCGTGRAAVELSKRGMNMLLIDFADNARDEEAMTLPFLEWDLCHPLPPHACYGICCDVMEHIHPDDVNTVVSNIMAAADRVFFSICTEDDSCGALIHDHLHLTVRTQEWWKDVLSKYGTIEFQDSGGGNALFVVHNGR